MKISLKIIGLISILTLLIAGAGCKRQDHKNNAKKTAARPAAEGVEAFGTVKIRTVKDVIVDFPAKVEKVYVKEGQRVGMGDPLVALNIADYEAEIRSKLYDLNMVRQELQKDQKDLEQLKNDLKDAESNLEQAKNELTARQDLYDEGAISRFDLENYKQNFRSKQKAVSDIQLAINNKTQGIASSQMQQEKIALLESELARMRAKLAQHSVQGDLIVSDLKNGVVFDIGYAAGDAVSSLKKVLSIMDLDTLYVEAEVAEEFVKDVRIGAEAIVVPVADSDRKYRGRVVKIANIAIKKEGETIVLVEIALDSPDEFMRPNFNVDINIKKP